MAIIKDNKKIIRVLLLSTALMVEMKYSGNSTSKKLIIEESVVETQSSEQTSSASQSESQTKSDSD